HGDFTPRNVIVRGDGRGVLIDFGCARRRGQRSELVAGTPGFIAPEVLATGVAEPGSDLYAVGVCIRTLYELAGARPRRAIAELVERLVDERPERRPRDVDEVLEALGARRPRAPGALSARSLVLVG